MDDDKWEKRTKLGRKVCTKMRLLVCTRMRVLVRDFLRQKIVSSTNGRGTKVHRIYLLQPFTRHVLSKLLAVCEVQESSSKVPTDWRISCSWAWCCTTRPSMFWSNLTYFYVRGPKVDWQTASFECMPQLLCDVVLVQA